MARMQSGRRWATWLACALLLLGAVRAQSRSVPDPSNPLGFFTTVADKMLRSTFQFGVTNIPVYSNGVYVYTPAVQRLLQLSANLLDASNTNFFPSVFRPLFANDGSNNVFIIGYQQVTNVSGTSDPQLTPPHPVSDLLLFNQPFTPIYDSSGFVNVYGVPWIIGAKKGLPNFNQFYMVNQAQVTRKLEVTRTSTDPRTAVYNTNQMYVIGISNSLGITWWNSYSNAYPRPLLVYASDVVSETLTNAFYTWSLITNFTTGGLPPGTGVTINPWQGSHWTGLVPNAAPSANSFVTTTWVFTFQRPLEYDWANGSFDLYPNPVWQTTTPPLPELPQFGVLITNYLQAYVLDGSNVVDYVHLHGPISVTGLNQALADPDYTNPASVYYQWSTNVFPSNPTAPSGVLNQLYISGHPSVQDGGPTSASLTPPGGQWSTSATPMGQTTPLAEAAYFNGFFVPNFQYGGISYVNNQLTIQAPYTPSRIIYSSFLLQANDPLIHYLASDLNSQTGSTATWQNQNYKNATWYQSDSQSQPLPVPPLTPIKGQYQPWGANGQMSGLGASVDPNVYNLADRDPLVWNPDCWNFPTNLMQSLPGLGQVHRGTPWQTFYLKSSNILQEVSAAYGGQNVGTNTWRAWTADFNAGDATVMAPATDWRLAGLLMSLLNTNDPTQLFPINDSTVTDWQNVLNGLVVYSNSAPLALQNTALQFDTYLISSNSPQASTIASSIIQARTNQTSPFFYTIGDILATPALTIQSPFVNNGSATGFGKQQWAFGIPDSVYEAIPAQLLPLLRPDSIGSLAEANNKLNIKFSGADGYFYALQTSTNLANWSTVSTNQPVQGTFNVPANAASPGQFFRTVLLP